MDKRWVTVTIKSQSNGYFLFFFRQTYIIPNQYILYFGRGINNNINNNNNTLIYIVYGVTAGLYPDMIMPIKQLSCEMTFEQNCISALFLHTVFLGCCFFLAMLRTKLTTPNLQTDEPSEHIKPPFSSEKDTFVLHTTSGHCSWSFVRFTWFTVLCNIMSLQTDQTCVFRFKVCSVSNTALKFSFCLSIFMFVHTTHDLSRIYLLRVIIPCRKGYATSVK